MAGGPRTGKRATLHADLAHEHAASVRAVEKAELNQFTACLKALEALAAAIDAPLAIVGGLAAIHHGAGVATLDVEVSVGRDDARRFFDEAPRHGFTLKKASDRGWHQFVFHDPAGDVDVHIIPEGERSPRDPAHAPAIPGPRDLGVTRGVAYADFASWMAMKLVSGREKDRYHLIEALKRADQSAVASVVVKLRPLDPSYLRELERLIAAAGEEKQDSW